MIVTDVGREQHPSALLFRKAYRRRYRHAARVHPAGYIEHEPVGKRADIGYAERGKHAGKFFPFRRQFHGYALGTEQFIQAFCGNEEIERRLRPLVRDDLLFGGSERERKLHGRAVIRYAAYIRGYERVRRAVLAAFLIEIENYFGGYARYVELYRVCKATVALLGDAVRKLLQQRVRRKTALVLAASAAPGKHVRAARKRAEQFFEPGYYGGKLFHVDDNGKIFAVIALHLAVFKREIQVLPVYIFISRERDARQDGTEDIASAYAVHVHAQKYPSVIFAAAGMHARLELLSLSVQHARKGIHEHIEHGGLRLSVGRAELAYVLLKEAVVIAVMLLVEGGLVV